MLLISIQIEKTKNEDRNDIKNGRMSIRPITKDEISTIIKNMGRSQINK